MPYEIEVTATCTASREAVFKHLSVAEAWNEWARLPTRARRESEGAEVPNGVGAVRRIPPVREKVVVHDPPRHYAYVGVSGLPLRDYRSDVTLEPHGVYTLVRWRAAFEPKIPGTGPIARFVVRLLITSFARRLAWHSQHCEPGCPARLPTAH
ncbi:MAG: SRPBCC family protein [Actinomadura rubrobrunea]|nr:SRPBCC family protein [Actinomadura rubrobrunea]